MKAALVFLLLLTSPFAHAEAVPALTAAISSAIGTTTAAANSCSATASDDTQPWALSWMFLTFSPEVTFGLTSVLSVSVQPEVDLIWQRMPAPSP